MLTAWKIFYLGNSADLDGGVGDLFGKYRHAKSENKNTGKAWAHINHLISVHISCFSSGVTVWLKWNTLSVELYLVGVSLTIVVPINEDSAKANIGNDCPIPVAVVLS